MTRDFSREVNKKVRDTARVADIPLYAIAHEIGVSEPTFFRWMRFPLPEDKEKKILDAIASLSKKGVYRYE